MLKTRSTTLAALVGAATSVPAFAVDISAGVPVNNIVYMSGASAPTASIRAEVAAFCSVALQVYADNLDGRQAFVYKCTNATAASGFGAAAQFIVLKRDKDGSFAGVGPVLASNAADPDPAAAGLPGPQLDWPDITNCTAAAPLTCEFATTPTIRQPDSGISDVERRIWEGRGQLEPYSPFAASTTRQRFVGQGFGLAVTNLLYTALQNKQIADLRLGAGCAGLLTAECRPSLSKEEYTSIASLTGGYATDWQPLVGAAGAGKNVNVCRRVSTSGTQASSDLFFLHSPCAAADPTQGQLVPAAAPGTADRPVIENSTTGNVRDCLNNRNAGTLGADNTFAIGVVSLENDEAAANQQWKYVRLNGTSPVHTLAGAADPTRRDAVVNGVYEFAFELQALWRNSLPAVKRTFMGNLVNALASTTTLPNGIYIVPGALTHAGAPDKVHKGTRGGNSCQAFELFE